MTFIVSLCHCDFSFEWRTLAWELPPKSESRHLQKCKCWNWSTSSLMSAPSRYLTLKTKESAGWNFWWSFQLLPDPFFTLAFHMVLEGNLVSHWFVWGTVKWKHAARKNNLFVIYGGKQIPEMVIVGHKSWTLHNRYIIPETSVL